MEKCPFWFSKSGMIEICILWNWEYQGFPLLISNVCNDMYESNSMVNTLVEMTLKTGKDPYYVKYVLINKYLVKICVMFMLDLFRT